MKKYVKPYIEIISIEKSRLMNGSKEPEVTGNIGAKENDMFFDWDEDEFADLWEEEEKENKELW